MMTFWFSQTYRPASLPIVYEPWNCLGFLPVDRSRIFTFTKTLAHIPRNIYSGMGAKAIQFPKVILQSFRLYSFYRQSWVDTTGQSSLSSMHTFPNTMWSIYVNIWLSFCLSSEVVSEAIGCNQKLRYYKDTC